MGGNIEQTEVIILNGERQRGREVLKMRQGKKRHSPRGSISDCTKEGNEDTVKLRNNQRDAN